MAADGDGFTVVSSKKKRNKNKATKTTPQSGSRDQLEQEDEIDTERMVEKVLNIKYAPSFVG